MFSLTAYVVESIYKCKKETKAVPIKNITTPCCNGHTVMGERDIASGPLMIGKSVGDISISMEFTQKNKVGKSSL